MASGEIINPRDSRALNTLASIEERNAQAKDAIKHYAKLHAGMDVAIGAAGFFGLAVPALIAAIAAQAPVIYRPLARELEEIYNREADAETGAIIRENIIIGGLADIAGEFSTEFLTSIAGELLTEAGLGGLASFIPIVGGIIGAGLDYVIATAMTWRVGVMVSIYYQNGGRWVGDRKHTYEIAKEITGGLGFGIQDLISKFSGGVKPEVNVDLNSIPRKVPEVRETQSAAARQMLGMLLQMGTSAQARDVLRGRGFPDFIIDAAFAAISTAVHQ